MKNPLTSLAVALHYLVRISGILIPAILFVNQIAYAAVPAVPMVSFSQNGNSISVSWSEVNGADGYILYHAPYPALEPITNIDMGLVTEAHVEFSNLDTHIVTVSAYNDDGESNYSNTPVVQLNASRSGGDTSINSDTIDAFSSPSPNLTPAELKLHDIGDEEFDTDFVAAPATSNGGLGPVFNQISCAACHVNDGRPVAPDHGDVLDNLFLKLSLPGADKVTGAPLPVPGFGTQLFSKAIDGVIPEASVSVAYQQRKVVLANGREVLLRKPEFEVIPYQPLPENVLFSPRMAPPVFGRGLLQAIPEKTLLALSDEHDTDGDGISGKPNYVWNPESQSTQLGRFGLKAGSPNLRLQTAAAFHGDMGITSSIFTQESSAGQIQHDGHGDDPELDDDVLAAVVFYGHTLAVPEKRNLDQPQYQKGQLIFAQAQCSSCHIPTLMTGPSEISDSVANQVIHPYTDLLLHDMGKGLADSRAEFQANGREWRTPPLWGIGLTDEVNGHTTFLHDGRARNVLEAIMWHGGEAQAARKFVANLPEDELDALLMFINSL